MRIGGLQKLTLIDYPGRMAATVFTVGCNMRCPFCHNPELVHGATSGSLETETVWEELEARRGFLDAVVVSGGEPTLQPDLPEFIERLKQTGLLVKLDTNGLRPDVLEDLLRCGLIDYVAMDVKAPFGRYAEFTGIDADPGRIEQAMALTRTAPAYEFRTTVAPGLTLDDLRQILTALRPEDAYFLQVFQVPEGKGLIDPQWAERPALASDDLSVFWGERAATFSGGGVRA